MWLRGSFTIEGAIIIPIFIFMMTIVMNMSLYMRRLKTRMSRRK